MSRINVLWVIDHVCYDGDVHGGGRLYWNLLPRFDESRFRVVACMLRAEEVIRSVFAQSPFPVRILDKAKFDPTALWTFLHLIREERIQVMHLHCYASSTFGRLAGLLTGVPAIIHDYDTEVYFPYPSYLGVADRLLAPATARAVAASPMVREFLIKRRRIDPSRIELMFHAVPMEKYAPPSASGVARVREQLGLGAKTRVVATMTKLGAQRGNEEFLRAAAQVLETFDDVVFALVYKQTFFHRLPSKKYVSIPAVERARRTTELEALARELGIEKKVRFVERQERADDLAAAADVVVAPFLSERFSSVDLLEAMAMGKPVVATDLGEPRELIADGVNGYRVPPGDVGALAERIAELVRDGAKLDRLSRGAREVAERHSVQACAEKLQRIYAELAAPDRAGRTAT